MSLKTLLMPSVSQYVLSHQRVLRLRAKEEARRQRNGLPHEVHYFHQVDDPYSVLLAQILPQFLARYEVNLVPYVVGPPPASAAPERERLMAYSGRDATLLAQRNGIKFGSLAPQLPDQNKCREVERALVAAVREGRFVELAARISELPWSNDIESLHELEARLGKPSGAEETQAHIKAANAQRQRWGHYLGATLYYAGEWYWGIDRLYHLEERLQELGRRRIGKDQERVHAYNAGR